MLRAELKYTIKHTGDWKAAIISRIIKDHIDWRFDLIAVVAAFALGFNPVEHARAVCWRAARRSRLQAGEPPARRPRSAT